MRNRFKDWLVFREEISWVDALRIFNYKPGDFVEPADYKKRYRTLVMTHHPDRGGNHADMVNVSLANDALQHFVGRQIPGSSGPSASTPPPKPEPRPEPKPTVSPTANWHDATLHGADRRTFGKWLHGGIVELLNTIEATQSVRNPDKLTSAIYHVGEIVGAMRRAFDEWKLKNRVETLLTSEDFYHVLESLDAADDAKAMRKVLKDVKAFITKSFYDKYIKDFPPSL